MSDISKTVTVEEFCDFLNDKDWWKQDFYFDGGGDEETILFDGTDYKPAVPGAKLVLERIEGEMGWQGAGDAPSSMPTYLTEFFEQWREKRDFVYITLKVSKLFEAEVRHTLAQLRRSPRLEGETIEVKG
jgi:hypothetical protein